MNPTKTSKHKAGRAADSDETALAGLPRLSIAILLFLYTIFMLVPVMLYRAFATLTFILTHMYIFHLINFFSVALLWAIIVPLVLGLPNRREFIGYAKSIRLTKIKPVLRSIGLGLITAIATLTLMLFSNFLSSLFNGQVVFDPALLIDPFVVPNIYTALLPGIWEEVAFRGVMLVLILKVQNKQLSIIGNGMLFGGFHSVGILTGFLSAIFFGVEFNRENFIPILFQIVYTTFFGIFIAYMFVKTRMLLPCILMHYIADALFYLVGYNTEPLTWSYFLFMTFVGFGLIPMIVNILIVRGFCFWFPEPDDEIIPFFDTFLVREKRLKQYKKNIKAA